jgi:molybdate transport system substrate-binding protein
MQDLVVDRGDASVATEAHEIVTVGVRYAARRAASTGWSGEEGDGGMPARGHSVRAGLVVRLAVLLSVVPPVVVPWAASARAAAPDVIVYGDSTLRHALLDVGARFTAQTGVPVHVFATPPTIIVAQLRHQVWNDVVVMEASWMDQAVQAGVIENGTRIGAWRNTLVFARATGVTAGHDVMAVIDPTPAGTIDGPAVLAALGLHPAEVQGVANAANVAFLVESGAAAQGLVHLTDVRADPGLRVAADVAASAYAPIVYVAAISTLTHSPNARAFLEYLHTPAATEVLIADGLEPASREAKP